MSNELKLIEALCEALGFNVVAVKDYQERKITINEAKSLGYIGGAYITYTHGQAVPTTAPQIRKLKTVRGAAFDIDDNGMYTEQLIEPVVSYKVEPKPRARRDS